MCCSCLLSFALSYPGSQLRLSLFSLFCSLTKCGCFLKGCHRGLACAPYQPNGSEILSTLSDSQLAHTSVFPTIASRAGGSRSESSVTLSWIIKVQSCGASNALTGLIEIGDSLRRICGAARMCREGVRVELPYVSEDLVHFFGRVPSQCLELRPPQWRQRQCVAR